MKVLAKVGIARLTASALVALVALWAGGCDDAEDAGRVDSAAGDAATTPPLDLGGDAFDAGDAEPADAGADGAVDLGLPAPGPEASPGSETVAVHRATLARDTADGPRTVPVLWFYPTADAAESHPLSDLLPAEHRAQFDAWAAAAPAGCVTPTLNLALDGAPRPGAARPLVVGSHCHGCLALSLSTVARHLASHGYVVAVVEHPDGTVFDESPPLNTAFLAVRVADVEAVIDDALAGGMTAQVGALDADRLGLMGHSFGSVTAGRVTQDDLRAKAVLALAAPIDNPLLPGTRAANFSKPALFWRAEEDGSITVAGNALIESNYNAVLGPAWLWKVAEAGHFGLTDIAGLTPALMAGCGEGRRQVGRAPFTWLAPEQTRAIAAHAAVGFFDAILRTDAGAESRLITPGRPEITAESRGSASR